MSANNKGLVGKLQANPFIGLSQSFHFVPFLALCVFRLWLPMLFSVPSFVVVPVWVIVVVF